MERPWLPPQSICFLPVLWNLQDFKKVLKILHLVAIFFQHNHFNRTNWLEEYLIILIPSTMVLAMFSHKFIFILYTMGYSLAENTLYQHFSWMSWCIWTTEWFYEANIFCQFWITDNIAPFLCQVVSHEIWSVVPYWYWQMPLERICGWKSLMDMAAIGKKLWRS